MDIAFGLTLKKIIANPRLPAFSAMSSCRSYLVRSVFRFMFLHVDVPVVPAPFFLKAAFSPLYCLCHLVRDQLTASPWVFLGARRSTDPFTCPLASLTLSR